MPTSEKHKRQNVAGVQAHRARQKVKERESRLFAEMVVDRMVDEGVITVRPELSTESIDFVWGPDTDEGRIAYADMEAFCQEHGRTFGEVMVSIEGIILDRLLPKLGKKLAGPAKWTPTAEEKAEYREKLGVK